METANINSLLDAAMSGDLDKVRSLVEEIGDVNCDVSGRTAALHAAYSGQLDVLRYLHENGAEVNRQLDTGATPLHYACQGDHLETVNFLVNEASADLSLTDLNGRTPLINAAYCGSLDIVKILVEGGSEIDVQDKGGFTALACAAEEGIVDVVEYLCGVGANIGIPGWNGNTDLHLAAKNGHYNVVKVLLSKKPDNSNIRNYYGYTPAQLAVENLGENSEFLPAVLEELHSCISRPPQKVALEDFVAVAQPIMQSVGPQNVLVISRENLLAAGEMPHYHRCEEEDWHRAVEAIQTDCKVLFVSHRWDSIDFPDPGNLQFNIVRSYLQEKGKDIDYVWLDYASICQDRDSEKFRIHLQNIPTAIWCSSRCLIIPKVNRIDCDYSLDETEITNLADYIGRAWCMFEAMAALLTGTAVTCSFQLGDVTEMVDFMSPEGASSSMGFFQAFCDVCHGFAKESNKSYQVWLDVGQDKLNSQWQIEEPCDVLGLMMKIVREQQRYESILTKAKTLEVQICDVERGGVELQQLWQKMGECSVIEDKLVVLNLMLFVGIYSLQVAISKEHQPSTSVSLLSSGSKDAVCETTNQGCIADSKALTTDDSEILRRLENTPSQLNVKSDENDTVNIPCMEAPLKGTEPGANFVNTFKTADEHLCIPSTLASKTTKVTVKAKSSNCCLIL